METGNADTPVGNGTLIIKRVNNQEAPNNGVVLEFGYDNKWAGQLYIGDNAHQGIYYNGWSNGVRGSWRRLADEPVSLFYNPSGTTGTVQLLESAANFSYLEIYYFLSTTAVGKIYSSRRINASANVVELGINRGLPDNNLQIVGNLINISGTSITRTYNGFITTTGGVISGAGSSVLYITNVAGYR